MTYYTVSAAEAWNVTRAGGEVVDVETSVNPYTRYEGGVASSLTARDMRQGLPGHCWYPTREVWLSRHKPDAEFVVLREPPAAEPPAPAERVLHTTEDVLRALADGWYIEIADWDDEKIVGRLMDGAIQRKDEHGWRPWSNVFDVLRLCKKPGRAWLVRDAKADVLALAAKLPNDPEAAAMAAYWTKEV